MSTVQERLQAVRDRIAAAAAAAQRDPHGIRLVAVSKAFPPSAVIEAIAAGQLAFGENYVQEAADKMAQVKALLMRRQSTAPAMETASIHHSSGIASAQARRPAARGRGQIGYDGDPTREGNQAPPAADGRLRSQMPDQNRDPSRLARPLLHPPEWHFVGPIQSNKTGLIAGQFDWVHSLDRFKIAQRLSAARPAGTGDLDVCIQVNVSGEASKGGVVPEAVSELAAQVVALPRLRLRGLMTVPRPTFDPTEQRAQFRVLRELMQRLSGLGVSLDTLSMGMSDDLEAAIAEGATLVRVGRAIFGERVRR